MRGKGLWVSREWIENEVIKEVSAQTGIDSLDINSDDEFEVDLDCDPQKILDELILLLEREFDIDLSDSDLRGVSELETIDSMVTFIVTLLENKGIEVEDE